MDTVTVALEDLDLVVESFTGAIGFPVLPTVLDVGAVVPDGVGAPSGALMGRGGIYVKPVCEHNSLQRIRSLREDAVENHEGFIGLPEIVGKKKGAFQQPGFEGEGVLPVLFLICDRGREEPGGALEDMIGSLIAIGAEGLLKSTADFRDIVIQEPDDMEHIDAYFDIREALFGEGDKTAVHVTAEEENAAALLQGIIPKISDKVFEIHAGKDIDDASGGTIRDIAVETVNIPTLGILIINPGRALKLVNAEGLRQAVGFGEVNGAEDRKHLGFRETVVDGNVTERAGGHERGADRKPCGDRKF